MKKEAAGGEGVMSFSQGPTAGEWSIWLELSH